jgi:hypothetical protein
LKLVRDLIRDFKASFSSGEFLNNLWAPMPTKSKSPIPIENIDEMIRTIRGARALNPGAQNRKAAEALVRPGGFSNLTF